jgi:hypothetical protein
MTVTVDRSAPTQESMLEPSALLVQHSLEYGGSDAAGVQRGVDFLNAVCDQGWIGHHMSGATFAIREIEDGYATSGNRRGLFDPATGNQAAVPAMARVARARRVLVVFGSPRSQSKNPSASNYDFLPIAEGKYAANGQTVVNVLKEAARRGTPFHAVSKRQELKGQSDRNFGKGGGGQSEVDMYSAVYEAVKAYDPSLEVWGPHQALGGTQTVADHNRPLKWPWDVDFLKGWMERVPGWDRVMLDYATANGTQSLGDCEQMALWVSNWATLIDDFWSLAQPYFGPSKPERLGFIEVYPLTWKTASWAAYTPEQKAAFWLAMLFQQALGGVGPTFCWQPEGAYENGQWADYFGWFTKTAVTGQKDLTGRPTAAGKAMQWLHDLLPVGTPLYPVKTGNPRVYGVATDTLTLLVNLSNQTWADTVEEQAQALPPYSYTAVPAAKPPATVTIPLDDAKLIHANLQEIKALADQALDLLPTRVKGHQR